MENNEADICKKCVHEKVCGRDRAIVCDQYKLESRFDNAMRKTSTAAKLVKIKTVKIFNILKEKEEVLKSKF